MKSRSVNHEPTLHETALKSEACYIAMVDESGAPYVIPMNFGLKDGIVYLHSAQKGKKITILKNNPKVCVCFSSDHQLRWQNDGVACSYGMKYRSVLAHGRVEFIDSDAEKISALNVIMRHYTGKDFSYSAPSVKEVMVWRVIVENWEGRNYGY